MRLIRHFAILCGGLIFFISGAFAEECDDFQAATELSPSNVALNQLINDELESFAASYKESCDRKTLVKYALYKFDQNFSNIGNRLRDRDQKYPGIEYGNRKAIQSVYKKNGEVFCCTSVINISNQTVGIDKVDHFFGNGGLIWEEYEKLEQKSDDVALKMNVLQEDGTWGLTGSKVKSYGDLAANWDGFNFYKELFDGPTPYFSCSEGKLKLNRKFEIEKYFKLSWRESANCSAFPTEKAAQSFANTLNELGLKCPMQEDDCKKMIELYGDNKKVLNAVVSPVCLQKIPLEKSVEESAGINWRDAKNILRGLKVKDAIKIITGAQ